MGFAGLFGGGMLFPETLNTPLLKASLARVLREMPFYSGRLVFAQDGRLDVRCNDAGARFVVASTSATVADLAAAIGSVPYGRVVSNPWMPYWPPHDIDQLWPLAAGFVMHFSGGGTALWVAAHHCCADFESLQTLAAHWAAAYNAALAPPPQPPSRPQGAAAEASGPPASAPPPPPSSAAPAAVVPPAGSGGYQSALPEGLRAPRLVARRCGALEEPGASQAAPPADLPPRREVAEAAWWSGLAVTAYAMYHMMWRGGGVERRCCRVSAQRLAELKAQASAELAAERRAGSGSAAQGSGGSGSLSPPEPHGASPGRNSRSGGSRSGSGGSNSAGDDSGADCAGYDLSGVEWISTNDALVARLLQVLHSLPLRRASRLGCFVAADMRRRLQPPLPPARLGNLLYNAHLAELAPSDTSLGRLAGCLRHALTYHLVPQFRGCLERTTAALARVGPRRLVFAFCLERRPCDNIFAPEGPVNLTNWDVQYGLWQFGPSPPLAFLPLAEIGPCVVLLYPAGAAREDGVALLASMHSAAWRQLDAMGRGLSLLL
ncbi:hypothetical protein GPECTOR_7g1207 [Gonium pectorale]|uniref:Uncharacterized protein n=1 Tax=Gonium pectorale TaxID=33097 RepID=A0A150GU90_GONPE|nr:hypothetical protein GPECTOR_7g1207 [Gonium pectorale]|eukprot:KXZ53313.1 hypothetical protein GPECTOR_7g1207 [Gonium pectorale]